MRNLIPALLISLCLTLFGVAQVFAAGITVNSAADDIIAGDGQCTLREAIANANGDTDTTSGDCVAGFGTDTITFNLPVASTITLTGTQLSLTNRLTIDGNAAPGLQVSGNNASRVFEVQPSAIITMQNFSIISGTVVADNGGGIRVTSNARLTLNSITISGSSADLGGGIYNNDARLTLINSTIMNNSAAIGGGGIYVERDISTITNTTISGNSSIGLSGGGGILQDRGTLNIFNSTIASNSDPVLAGGIRSRRGTLNLSNTIVANNGDILPNADMNVHGSVTQGTDVNNLVERGNFGNPVTTFDPLLGPLQNNGGATLTHALLSGSPAIDSGDTLACPLSDQTGQVRPAGAACDLGAVESQTPATCLARFNANTTTFAGWDAEPVRQAIAATGSGGTVKLAGFCPGVSFQAGTTQVAYINKTLTIRGGYAATNWLTSDPIAQPTTLDAQAAGRVLRIEGNITVNLENLWLQNGLWTVALEHGGGVLVNNAAVTISGATITGNSVSAAGTHGGGIYSNRSITLTNTSLIGNTAGGNGGGMLSTRNIFMSNSRVVGNTAAGNGGGVLTQDNLVLQNSVILNNRAENNGGGVYVRGNTVGGPSQISNNLVAGNSSGSGRGGGLLLIDSSGGGQVNLMYTTVASPTTGSGAAIYVNNVAGTVNISNTIIANYATGLRRNAGVVNENFNLFFGNTIDRDSVTTGLNSLNGDPAFVNPAAEDYHLTAASAAVDKATDVGLTTDFEGEIRPQGFDFDIGFDESPFVSGERNCYTSLSTAVEYGSNDAQALRDAIAAAASGQTVKVAGVCAGTFSENGTAQVAYISKDITVQGGYTLTNWLTPDPVANPTVLDAQSTGRVLRLNGAITVNVENLHLRNGLWTVNSQHGGGLLANNAVVNLNGVTFSNNAVTGSNSNGGGLYSNGTVTISNSQFNGNSASWLGGGLYAGQDLFLTDSSLTGNTAGSSALASGGGFYVVRNAYLTNSLLRDNRALTGSGGGGFVFRSVAMTDTRIISNSAQVDGGGLYLNGNGGSGQIVNSLVAGNTAASRGSGLYLFDTNGGGGQVNIIHTTLANPALGSGAAVYVNKIGSTVNVTNSIIANYAIGLQRVAGTMTENYNLFSGNTAARSGVAVGANSLNGNPVFVNPAAEDYHLGSGSAALDNGTNAGISTDFEGEARPIGSGFDRGFDEYSGGIVPTLDLVLVKSVQPSIVLPGQLITFTLRFTATGQASTATAVRITDTMPSGVINTSFSSSGVSVTQLSPGYIWSVQDLSAGQSGTITVVGTVANNLPPGQFVNTATIGAAQAENTGNNTSSVTVTVEDDNPAPRPTTLYLPLVFGNYVSTVDLVIDDLVASSSAVTVTVRNAGNSTLTDAFWVDVYFDPSQTPAVNKGWPAIAPYGVVWGVTQPLGPNESLVLTLNGPYYSTKYSSALPLPSGATVYGLADSINYATTFGNVAESDESNNLFGPVISSAAAVEMRLGEAAASPPDDELPGRE